MKYLLDTNAFIEHLRLGPASKVTSRMTTAAPRSVFLCSIVLAELLFGARRSPPNRIAANLALVANLQQRFPSVPFDDAAADEYGTIRAHLTSVGRPIGPNDLMIAAIALANQMTLITHNVSEFGRVPGLHIEDWQ